MTVATTHAVSSLCMVMHVRVLGMRPYMGGYLLYEQRYVHVLTRRDKQ